MIARKYTPSVAIIPPLEQLNDLRAAGIVMWKTDAKTRRTVACSANYVTEFGFDPTGKTAGELFGITVGDQARQAEDRALTGDTVVGPMVLPDGRAWHVIYRASGGLIHGLAVPLHARATSAAAL